MHIILCPMNT